MDPETLYDEYGIDRRGPRPNLSRLKDKARTVGPHVLRSAASDTIDDTHTSASSNTEGIDVPRTKEERLAIAAAHLAAMRQHLKSLE